MKKDVATQQACGCDLHSSLKPETWKLHHHLGSFHPRCLTSKVMSAWPPNLTNMVSGFRIHFGALKMSGLSRAENHLRLSLLPWFFWSKGWAMAEKARPRIVAERHRLSFGHCHRDPHLNDPPFLRPVDMEPPSSELAVPILAAGASPIPQWNFWQNQRRNLRSPQTWLPFGWSNRTFGQKVL